jgi:hypothetical protein
MVAELIGEDYANAYATANPLAVVEGRAIPTHPVPILPQKKKWWRLFGG